MRRIVVTGMGAVSPLGCGVETNWSRLLAGRSGIRTLPEAITADLSAKVGGQVPDVAVDPEGGFDPDRVAPRKDQRKMDRFILFALLAADEAIAQANWKPEDARSRQRTATVIASGIGGFPAIADAVRTTDIKGVRRLSPFHSAVVSRQPRRGSHFHPPQIRGRDRRAGHGLRRERTGDRRRRASNPCG